MFGKSNILLILACLLGILFPLRINAQKDPTFGAADNNNNNAPLTVHMIIVGIILIITGLIYCFYGRRYYRVTLFLIGFYIGAIIAWIVLNNGEPVGGFVKGKTNDTIILLVSLAVGFITGSLFLCCSTLAVWLLGALAGYSFALFILAWGSNGLISNGTGRIIFIIALTAAGLLLAIFFKSTFIILSTAFIGAYATILGIDMFARTGFAQSVVAFLVRHETHYETNTKIYLMLAGMVALFLLGSVYQYRYHRTYTFGGPTKSEAGKKKFFGRA